MSDIGGALVRGLGTWCVRTVRTMQFGEGPSKERRESLRQVSLAIGCVRMRASEGDRTEFQAQINAHGKTFTIRVIDLQRSDLTYESYCLAEAPDGDIVQFLIRFTTLRIHAEQNKKNLPQGSSLIEALKRKALDRAGHALLESKRSRRITIKSDGTEDVQVLNE